MTYEPAPIERIELEYKPHYCPPKWVWYCWLGDCEVLADTAEQAAAAIAERLFANCDFPEDGLDVSVAPSSETLEGIRQWKTIRVTVEWERTFYAYTEEKQHSAEPQNE